MFYRELKEIRQRNFKTQQELAGLLGMQQTEYSRYERGERELPLWAAIKLADYYKVSLDYLVGRTR